MIFWIWICGYLSFLFFGFDVRVVCELDFCGFGFLFFIYFIVDLLRFIFFEYQSEK